MTLTKTLSATAVLLAFAGSPAAAQMYPGQDVTVNPYAVPRSPLVLYPGGMYTQGAPGGSGGTIHLHMPVHHRHVAKVVPTDTTIADRDAHAPTAASTSNYAAVCERHGRGGRPAMDTAAAPPPPAPPHHKHSKPVETASAAPAAAAPDTTQARRPELPMNLDGTDPPPPATPAKPAKAPARKLPRPSRRPRKPSRRAPSAHA